MSRLTRALTTLRNYLPVSRQRFDESQQQVASLETRSRFGKERSAGTAMTYGSFEYEQNRLLRGDERWDTLAKMVTDPHVKGAVVQKTAPLVRADWEIKPASEDDRNVEIAEFCSANLLRQSTERFGKEYWVQTSWEGQRLPEILNFLETGFAIFNKTWRRAGTKMVYDRLQWLEPSSVDPRGWKLDDVDNIVQIERTYSDPKDEYKYFEPLLPEDLALYVWEMKGARYEGTPFIRSLYGPWFRKDLMQKWAVIWAQKAGAPVPTGYYPKSWGQEPGTLAKFEKFIRSMRGTAPAEAYGMFPKGTDGESPEVGYAESKHAEVDRLRSLLDGENKEIAHGGGTKSMMLGETGSGSRSLGESQGLLEMAIPEAIAVVVCEIESHGVGNVRGVIEDLVDANYSDVQAYPELVVSKINPFEGMEHFDQILAAWGGGIIPHTPAARRQIVEGRLGLNLPDDAYEIEEQPVMVPGDTDAPPNGKQPPMGTNPDEPDDDGPDGPEAQMSLESEAAFRERIAPLLQPVEGAPDGGNFRRAPTQLESACVSLAAVSTTLDSGEQATLAVLRRGHRSMIAELIGRARNGDVRLDNLDKQRRSAFRGARSLRNALAAELRRVGDSGREHVKIEIERQVG